MTDFSANAIPFINEQLNDPGFFVRRFWPHINLYDKQVEILESVRDNDETYVPAGNGLGKDFIAALCILWFFCSRRPARVATTSVESRQLERILWGEIHNFIRTSVDVLPFQVNMTLLRQTTNSGEFIPKAEVTAKTCREGEALLGAHLPRGPNGEPTTLAIFDEASGIKDNVYNSTNTWAHRKLIIGNCFPCTNFFFRGVKGGDLWAEDKPRKYRNVIHIKAEDSPNIQLTRAEQKAGKPLSGKVLVPGLIDYDTYTKHRATMDVVMQCISLDGEFYEDAATLLFPPEWLNNAEQLALTGPTTNRRKTLGVDTAFGGDNTAWAVSSDWGLEELISVKTPDISVIMGQTRALMREHGILAKDVLFDAGGGGAVYAGLMRKEGDNVQSIAFGGTASLQRKRGMTMFEERKQDDETRYVYTNRRAEMYGMTSRKLDPDDGGGFAIDKKYTELRRQLGPVPRLYDGEGRLYLPPKQKKNREDTEITMTELVGCSPDEADALVLSIFGLGKSRMVNTAGAIL